MPWTCKWEGVEPRICRKLNGAGCFCCDGFHNNLNPALSTMCAECGECRREDGVKFAKCEVCDKRTAFEPRFEWSAEGDKKDFGTDSEADSDEGDSEDSGSDGSDGSDSEVEERPQKRQRTGHQQKKSDC